jgi:hypothetical protein
MKLQDINTLPADTIKKEDIEPLIEDLLEQIRDYQRIMYAQKKYSMLIIFQ